MRLSFREIEAFDARPAQWLTDRLGGSHFTPVGGYGAMAREGIYRFLKHSEYPSQDIEAYVRWRISRLRVAGRPLTDQGRIDRAVEWYRRYRAWHVDAGLIVADVQGRIALPLNDQVALGGEVSRLDVVDSGVRGVLILTRQSPDSDWAQSITMKILQRAVARTYGVPDSQVEVAVQSIDASRLESISYSNSELTTAWARLEELAGLLRGRLSG